MLGTGNFSYVCDELGVGWLVLVLVHISVVLLKGRLLHRLVQPRRRFEAAWQ